MRRNARSPLPPPDPASRTATGFRSAPKAHPDGGSGKDGSGQRAREEKQRDARGPRRLFIRRTGSRRPTRSAGSGGLAGSALSSRAGAARVR